MGQTLLRNDTVIDLSRNDLPLNIEEDVPALTLLLTGSGKFGPYSDDFRCDIGGELRATIARHEGVPLTNVRVVGSLLPEVESMAARLKCDHVVISSLDFPQYRRALLYGSKLVEIPVTLDQQDLDGAEAADAVRGRSRPIVFLTLSHMNPGMIEIKRTVIDDVRRANPDAIIVIDVAYRRFAPPQDYAGYVVRDRNLIMLQTASKHLGICGARVGWIVAHEDMLKRLDLALQPHLANALLPYAAGVESKRAALKLLQHPEVVNEITKVQQAARVELVQGLERQGLRIKTNEATPWVLLDLGVEALQITEDLKNANIFVQGQFPTISSLWRWARISATVPWQARAFITAMEQLTDAYPGIPKALGRAASNPA